MKKYMSALLAVSLVGVSAACSKEETNTTTTQPSTSASSAATATPSKPVTIEVERFFSVSVDPPAPDKDLILQTIKKDLNVDLKYIFSTGKSDDWRAKMGARIAANDLPDAIMYFNMGDYRKAQKDGYLLPLNDVFKADQLPGNMKYVTKEMMYYITDENGKYHGIPSRPPSLSNSLFIRKDWLDKLGLKMPTTTDELREVMNAFANRDPDGNGTKDSFGFSGTGSSMQQQMFWQFLSAFTGDVRGLPWIDKDGKLRGGLISNEFRQYLQFMQDLMKTGGLDPDMVTNNLDRVKQKVEQGQVGIFYNAGYPSDIVQNMKKINPKAEVVVLPPVTGPSGKGSNNGRTNAPNGVLGITVKAKDDPVKVQKIIELANWMSGGIGEELLTYGIEGLNHKKVDGKVTEFIVGKESNYLPAYSLVGEPALKTTPEAVKVFFPDKFLAEQQLLLLSDKPENGSIFSMGQAKEPTDLAADLNKYVSEMMLKFIYASVPLDDKNWEEYVKNYLEKYKGKEYLDRVNQELKKNGALK